MLTRWILWTNCLIAASAAGWVMVTIKALALPIDWALISLAFLLAFAFYTRDRIDPNEQPVDQRTMPERTVWVRRHMRRLQGAIWISFTGAVFLIVTRPLAAIPLLAGLGFALTYTVRWLPWRWT